ncbi:MAG: hypothetical protein ABIH46_03625 [Chloroflexota bacterium]
MLVTGTTTVVASPTRPVISTRVPVAGSSKISSAKTFNDPFAYCAACGTIDQPDSRYTGPSITAVAKGSILRVWPSFWEHTIRWRCMDGRVLVCDIGANNPCWKVDTSREPNQGMAQYCQHNPEANFIPAVITGHSTIYRWACQRGLPVIVGQIFTVDSRGFASELWHEISP